MINLYMGEKYIYSTDMMLSYVNLCKPKYETLSIRKKDEDYLDEGVLWDGKDTFVPYNYAIKHKKKFKEELERIKNANLKYPIIILKLGKTDIILDGAHRFIKSIITKKKTIKAYIIYKKLLNKFKIAKASEEKKIDTMSLHFFITKFFDTFCEKFKQKNSKTN